MQDDHTGAAGTFIGYSSVTIAWVRLDVHEKSYPCSICKELGMIIRKFRFDDSNQCSFEAPTMLSYRPALLSLEEGQEGQ